MGILGKSNITLGICEIEGPMLALQQPFRDY